MTAIARIIHKAQTAYRRLLGIPLPIVTTALGGRLLRVREGAVPPTPQMDYGWIAACALRAVRVFDVGSNIGQAALIMLLSSTLEEIVMVEANPLALSVAADNLIMNHLIQRVRMIAAFADQRDDDEVTLWTYETGAAGSVYRERAQTAARRNTSMQVPTVTLDTLMSRFGAPDLVKIDVEGAELRVLEGATGIARTGKARFLVEMHLIPNLTMMQHIDLLVKWCDSVGYSAWYIHTSQRLPLGGIPDARCHILLQPKDWTYPEWLTSIPAFATADVALRQFADG
ncbi:MAG: FkbM family methyltransferase [Anaerolineae bacterium]|nr:FkbM family methyltransferase [Anaerolineae bacterium]NUQ04660.1 FkbM family methyltransferase [Anaerolineae bacterium]